MTKKDVDELLCTSIASIIRLLDKLSNKVHIGISGYFHEFFVKVEWFFFFIFYASENKACALWNRYTYKPQIHENCQILGL